MPRSTSRDRAAADRDAIRIGLIGASVPSAVNDIMRSLGPRLRLSCVYEPVRFLSPLVAEEAGVVAVDSLTKLGTRRGIQAAVVHAAGSLGVHLARPLLKAGLPILWFGATALGSQWRSLLDLDDRGPIVPLVADRYTGSTLRLRELMTGPLGPARTIEATFSQTDEAADLIATLDWCRWVSQPRIARTNTWQWTFRAASGRETVADVRPLADGEDPNGGRHVVCELGEAIVHEDSLTWRRDGDADWTQADLSDEREAVEVAADLFARRVVGGLVPVASIAEIVEIAREVDPMT